ncbi:MAG: hypothetical protein IJN61_05095 [Clostridia bacterium]|nr:hypothetical protein [Clostridia bacterium]
MILITLGTNDKSFVRLLNEVQKLIDQGKITDRVVVQAGVTEFKSSTMEIFDLIPFSQFDDLINQCDLLITHGGVGSITTGLKKGKTVIAVPRLAQYGEHVNDHQLQIIDNFDKAGYIIGLADVSQLEEALVTAKTFTPNAYQSNTENMIALVKQCIEESL